MGYNFLLQKQICVCLIDFHRDIRLEVWMFCQFSEGNKQQNTHKNMASLGNFVFYPCSCMMVVVAKLILSIHHESSQHNKLSIQFITNTSISGIMEVNQSSMLNPWYLLHVMLGQENNPRGTKPFMLSQLQIFVFA